MWVALLLLASFLFVTGCLLGVGIGFGFPLHWILPELGLGSAILTGLVATAFSLLILGRFFAFTMRQFGSAKREDESDDGDDEFDEEDTLEREAIYRILQSWARPRQLRERSATRTARSKA